MNAAVSTQSSLEDTPDGAESDLGAVRRKLGIGFWLPVGWVVVICLAALFAKVLPLPDPQQTLRNLPERRLNPPSAAAWFGTDKSNRDMFSRCIYGARTSLTVGFTSVFMGLAIGGTLGIVAGYFRGWIDRVISFALLVLLSFPSIVLAILITSLVNRTLTTISLTIGILAISPIGRLARATTIQFADRDFVVAARSLGASNTRIIVRELLPNVLIPMGALALLGVSVAIVAEGALAYLGLSVVDGESWGSLIKTGADTALLSDAPWMAFAPILMMFLTVASLNLAGDQLRKYFDIKESAL